MGPLKMSYVACCQHFQQSLTSSHSLFALAKLSDMGTPVSSVVLCREWG